MVSPMSRRMVLPLLALATADALERFSNIIGCIPEGGHASACLLIVSQQDVSLFPRTILILLVSCVDSI